MKQCAACKEMKPFDDFYRMERTKHGRHPYCKVCAKKMHAEAYAKRGRDSWLNDKTCTWCQKLLPSESYARGEDGKRHTRCMDCERSIAEHEARGLRRCNICREWLPPGRFHPSRLRFEHIACIECVKAQVAQPKYRDKRRAYLLMKDYGLTLEQYDELEAKQGGKCPVCLEPLPPNRGGYVDHAHEGEHKGKIRAILHGICNRFVVWEHVDSGALRRAADLIDNPLTDWVVPGRPSSEVRKQARKQGKMK